MLERVCVFCGSSPGARPVYAEVAATLGRQLAQAGATVVYGGGNVGLMGVVADAALAAGGQVIGVIPQALADREVAHSGCTELYVVASMHERKAMMAELAQGFVALPGGMGTWEELFEILTWAQLGEHAKPVVVLDVEDYYAPVFALLDRAVSERFVRDDHRALARRATSVAEALDRLAEPVPSPQAKWIDRDQT